MAAGADRSGTGRREQIRLEAAEIIQAGASGWEDKPESDDS
jgi:hypothetical protein